MNTFQCISKLIRKKRKNMWIFLYWKAFQRLIQERYTYKASSLAFATLLTIVPMLLVLVSVVTIFPLFYQIINLAKEHILIHFMPNSSHTIVRYLEEFSQQAISLPFWNILFLLLAVFALGVTIEDSLSEIWSKNYTAKTLSTKIFHWLMLILTPFFIGIGVLISSYIFSLTWFSDISANLGLKLPLLALFSFFLNIAILVLFYTVVPSYKINLKDRFIGACTAAFLFEVGEKFFSFYVVHIHSYQLIYGAFSAIPIFLIWLYISWLIVLFGALVIDTRYQIRKKLIKIRS